MSRPSDDENADVRREFVDRVVNKDIKDIK